MAVLKLVGEQADADWKQYKIELPITRLGRSSPDHKNEVTFCDKAVSRKHAKILIKDGEYFIVDRDSRAGTFVNGRRLLAGEPHQLKHGESIRICKYLLMFSDGVEEADSNTSSVEVSETGESTGFSAVLDGSSSSILSRSKINPEAKLAAIIELTPQLNKVRNLEAVLVKATTCLLEVFPFAGRCIVVLPESEYLKEQVGLARRRVNGSQEIVQVSGQVLEEVLKQNVTALLPNQRTMCACLAGHDEMSLGMIQLDMPHGDQQFTASDLDLFATLATVIAFAVDNWILHGVAIRDRVTQLELDLARDVQADLLPKDVPKIPGYEFFDYYSPARQVGGDCYDYLQLDDKRLVVVLGDVSGKGIPAALLMVKVSSEINALLDCGMAPLDAMKRVNARFADRGPDGRFVTMVLAAIDLENHAITLVNAGHMRPILRHADGTMIEVGKGYSGLPLGILPDYEYLESYVSLAVGDTLVLFSDGVTDASNAEKVMFNMDGLRAAYAETPGTAIDVGKGIIRKIHNHVGGEPQTDDICLLCLSRLA